MKSTNSISWLHLSDLHILKSTDLNIMMAGYKKLAEATHHGHVSGVEHDVDVNVFTSSRDAWELFSSGALNDTIKTQISR